MANINFDNGITMSTVNAAFAAGATTTITSSNNSAGVINGEWVTTLTAANMASPTTDATTGVAFVALAPNQCCALVIGQNKAGTVKMSQGPIIAALTGVTTTVGGFAYAPQFPALPDDFMPMAYTLVQTAPSASAWTPGSSNWTASGVSATTFQNVAQLPKRPQIA